MTKIIAFLKLIRLPNLFIIVLAQYAMRWGVIYPMYTFLNKQLFENYPDKITNPHIIQFMVSDTEFLFLTIATVLIAAAGYIINDYFDVSIDRINKPFKMIIDKGIKRRSAMVFHIVISTVALCMAMIVSSKLGLFTYSLIYVAWALGLWLYSTEFKKQFLVGNILIALFVSLVPFIVGLYELQLAVEKYQVLTLPPFEVNFKIIFNFILAFSGLAFIINLIREIIKDIEDIEGDKAYGCRTIPIVLGVDSAKNLVSFLALCTMFAIAYIQIGQYQSGAILSCLYLFFFIQIPLIAIVFFLFKAQKKSDYKIPNVLSKFVMLTGILYSVVIYFSFIPWKK